MKRKLFSTLLCAFALLLLMGAGVEQDSAAAAIVIEEESASADGSAQVLETGIQTGIEAQDTPLTRYIWRRSIPTGPRPRSRPSPLWPWTTPCW